MKSYPVFVQKLRRGRLIAASALLLMCSTLTLNADPITREQARQRAEQFLQSRPGARQLSPVQNRARLAPRHGAPANPHDLYYVFDRGEGEGFVIASGDDRTEPVLGYCDQGSFDYSSLPDASTRSVSAEPKPRTMFSNMSAAPSPSSIPMVSVTSKATAPPLPPSTT